MATGPVGILVMTMQAIRMTIMVTMTTMRMAAGTSSLAHMPGTGTEMATD